MSQKQGSVIPEKGEEVRTFDEAVVRVRSGRGGDGELAERGKGRYVRNFKYRPGRNDPKQIWLPDSKPADGEDGGDVVVYCDPACQSLLHLSDKEVLVAPSGANGNPADGSRGPKRRVGGRGKAPALKVPVPPGTAVLRGGKRLAELVRPGDSVVVARGGMGGSGVVGQSREQRARDRARQAEAETRGEVVVNDVNWRADARGQAGEQATLVSSDAWWWLRVAVVSGAPTRAVLVCARRSSCCASSRTWGSWDYPTPGQYAAGAGWRDRWLHAMAHCDASTPDVTAGSRRC